MLLPPYRTYYTLKVFFSNRLCCHKQKQKFPLAISTFPYWKTLFGCLCMLLFFFFFQQQHFSKVEVSGRMSYITCKLLCHNSFERTNCYCSRWLTYATNEQPCIMWSSGAVKFWHPEINIWGFSVVAFLETVTVIAQYFSVHRDHLSSDQLTELVISLSPSEIQRKCCSLWSNINQPVESLIQHYLGLVLLTCL